MSGTCWSYWFPCFPHAAPLRIFRLQFPRDLPNPRRLCAIVSEVYRRVNPGRNLTAVEVPIDDQLIWSEVIVRNSLFDLCFLTKRVTMVPFMILSSSTVNNCITGIVGFQLNGKSHHKFSTKFRYFTSLCRISGTNVRPITPIKI